MFEGIFHPMHLLVVFFIALLVFGPKKLPELAKGIGAGIRALKNGIKDLHIEPGITVGAQSSSSGYQQRRLIVFCARASRLYFAGWRGLVACNFVDHAFRE